MSASPPPRSTKAKRSPAKRTGKPRKTPAQAAGRGRVTATRSAKGNQRIPTSTSSPRLLATHAELDREVRRRFPDAQATSDWGMRGWKVKRPKPVAQWKGTMDPNWLYIGLAERKQGITLHFWNPYDLACLQRQAARLKEHGLTAMVGCVQYTRKGDYPVDAIVPLLDEVAQQMRREAAT